MFAFLFFFFKQKTAYEMRISDWSSDVCSSDLPLHEIENQRFVRCGHDDSSGRSRRGKLSTEDALAAHPPFDSGRSFSCGRGPSILAAANSPAPVPTRPKPNRSKWSKERVGNERWNSGAAGKFKQKNKTQ